MNEAIVAAYDAVTYPSGVFRRTHPDRMAVVARLHGLTPPPIATARVLEIGGGDGLNVVSLAAAFPDASFLNIDISPPAVERGHALVRSTGLGNVRNEVMDVVDAANTIAGPFDYILAHGVYSWVPGNVREAVLRLAARTLSPGGVAFFSYNTVPHGYVRMALREMVLRAIGGIDDAHARVAAAHAMLAAYVAPREGDPPFVAVLREEARRMAGNQPASLFHDELATSYHPQAITAVIADAAAAGLAYLGETEPQRIRDGLLADDATDGSATDMARALEAEDYRTGRAFRNSLFVRADNASPRRMTVAAIGDLHISIQAERTAAGEFRRGNTVFEVGSALADRVDALTRIWPRSMPVADFVGVEDHDVVLRLFEAEIAELSTLPPRFAASAGDRPLASALARAIAGGGGVQNVTLDQRYLDFERPGANAFLRLLDGTRDHGALKTAWAAHPDYDGLDIEQGLKAVADAALLVR